MTVNKVWPAAKTQDDLVKREVGDGGFSIATVHPKTIGLVESVAGLPGTEKELSEVIHIGLRMYPNVQEFFLELGDFPDNKVSMETQRFPNISGTGKKIIAETLAREIVSNPSVVGLHINAKDEMVSLVLKSGSRLDEEYRDFTTIKNKDGKDKYPLLTVKYLKRQ